MARRRYTPEQIIGMLRESEVRLAEGGESGAICRELGISEQSYYRRRGEYGGLKVSQARPFERVGERDPAAQESCFNLTLDALILKEVVEGKVLSPSRCKDAVDHVQAALGCSERRACRVIGQPRSTQRRLVVIKPDEQPLTAEISRLAQRYGRYGYRRITGLLRNSGWHVNAKRVERIWRREGLKVPKQQPKRGRLWFNDGSCVRLRPQYKGHVWSYDFVMDRTHDGRAFRMLTVIDEYSRNYSARVGRTKSDIRLPIITKWSKFPKLHLGSAFRAVETLGQLGLISPLPKGLWSTKRSNDGS